MGSVVPEKILVNHNCYPLPTFFISVDSKGTLSCFRMNTSGSVHSKRVRGAFSAFRRHFPVSVDCKRVSGRKQRNCALLETAANAQRNISPGLAHPQYLHSIIHEELPKVNDDFRKGRGEAIGGRKTKKMRDLLMPSNNLTSTHSTCILRFELGLEREN